MAQMAETFEVWDHNQEKSNSSAPLPPFPHDYKFKKRDCQVGEEVK